MASMSRVGTGLARRGLLDESAALRRCTSCPERQAFSQTGRPRQPLPYSSGTQLAAHGGGARFYSQRSQQRPRFSSRLRMALGGSRTEWYFIPVGVGIGFLGLVQGYKVYSRENEQLEDGAQPGTKPKRRPRIRPDGPWQVQVMSTLPLKALSRLWGRFNEIDIPYYLRPAGFKLYSWIFGVK